MKRIKFISLLLVFFLISGSLLFAQQEEKALELLVKGKKLIYQKNWEQAIEAFQTLAKSYAKSEYAAESYYWMAYSMDKLSYDLENLERQLKMQEQALATLNNLRRGGGQT